MADREKDLRDVDIDEIIQRPDNTREELKKIYPNLPEGKEIQADKRLSHFPFRKSNKLLPKLSNAFGENEMVSGHPEPIEILKNSIVREDVPVDVRAALKKYLEGKGTELQTLKEPFLCLIRDDLTAQLIEEVPPGTLKLKESQTSDGVERLIILPMQKLLNFKYGDKTVRGWIAYEKEHVALPFDARMDSRIAYQALQLIFLNRKDFKAQEIKAYEGLLWAVVIAVIVIIGLIFWALPQFANVHLFPELTDPAFKAAKLAKAAADVNANLPVSG